MKQQHHRRILRPGLAVKDLDTVDRPGPMVRDRIAAGGTWRVLAYTDPKGASVGDTSFLVEDYIPDRIEFDLTANGTRVDRNAGASLTVDGRYLFGAPAAHLDIEGDVSVSADSQPFEQWKDYVFGLSDESVDAVQNTIGDLAQTDDKGHADITMPLPQLPTTSRPLKASFTIRMKEAGGRGVVRTASLPIAATGNMLGLKQEGEAGEGQQAIFSALAIDAEGNRVAVKGVNWVLKRLTTTYQWYKTNNRWSYEAVTTARKVTGGMVDIAADKPAQISAPVQWGQYRLEIVSDGLAPSSASFYAGYYTSEKANTPDMLPVALDRTSVKSGDTLTVKIDARFAGKASVQVVGERLFASELIDVPENGTTVPVKVVSSPQSIVGVYIEGSLLELDASLNVAISASPTAPPSPSNGEHAPSANVTRGVYDLDATALAPLPSANGIRRSPARAKALVRKNVAHPSGRLWPLRACIPL